MMKDCALHKADRPKHKEYNEHKEKIIVTIPKPAVVKNVPAKTIETLTTLLPAGADFTD